MSLDTSVRSVRFITPFVAFALATAVVMPPWMLVGFMGLAGLISLIFLWRTSAMSDLDRQSLLVVCFMGLAAVLCLTGMLPAAAASGIQPEFLKYSVYAMAFFVGFAAFRTPASSSYFVVAVFVLSCVFFIYAAAKSDLVFRISQAWMFYPPDQNNTASILIPLLPAVLVLRNTVLRSALLIFAFLFCALVENRLGTLIVIVVLVGNVFVERRSGLLTLILVSLVWLSLSFSETTFQDTLVRQIKMVVSLLTGEPLPADRQLVPKPLLEVGTDSDLIRERILERSVEIAIQAFPNLLGMGDAAVIAQLNVRPLSHLSEDAVFQHTHNFLLQGYLAYGLPATLCLVIAYGLIFSAAARRRCWVLIGTVVVIGGFGMVESLISDVRVLCVLLLFIGGAYYRCISGEERP